MTFFSFIPQSAISLTLLSPACERVNFSGDVKGLSRLSRFSRIRLPILHRPSLSCNPFLRLFLEKILLVFVQNPQPLLSFLLAQLFFLFFLPCPSLFFSFLLFFFSLGHFLLLFVLLLFFLLFSLSAFLGFLLALALLLLSLLRIVRSNARGSGS